MADNIGTVVQGAHSGFYVYWAKHLGIDKEAFYLSERKNTASVSSSDICLDTSTVVGYEEIGSRTGPNFNAVAKSTLLGGAALGLLASSVSNIEEATFVVFLKNKESCTIHLNITWAVEYFRRIFVTKKGAGPNGSNMQQGGIARVSGDPKVLLERAFMFLEDGDWDKADIYCESVLDQNPKCAEAYLGKLMAELQIPTQDKLQDNPEQPSELDNYKKALRFGDDTLRTMLTNADEHIHLRNLQNAYDNEKQQMETASKELEFNPVAEMFSGSGGFQDADELREECIRRAGECMKDEMYYSAKEKMDAGRYEKAIEDFKSISDWRDSAELISICQQKDGEKTIALKKRRKKIYILAAVAALAIVVIIAASSIISYVGILQQAKANVSDAKVGSIVTFGTYTEEPDTLEKSKIDWRVLAKEDDRILVISDRIIDAMPYHNVSQVDVTWETCSLRKWLNSAFINSAFNSAEKKLIIESEVLTEKASYSDTDSGNNTKDKIFLLSESEFEKYLHSDGSCFATNYATEKTAEGYYTYLYSWWLRSPGARPDSASDVFISTSDVDSTYAAYSHNGVRPAMWISVK